MRFQKRDIFLTFAAFVFFCTQAFCAESAGLDFSISVDSYLKIEPITSPVLIANVTDRTGNLANPLFAKFKVVTNMPDSRTLYLQAKTNTDSGQESAMFVQGGQVYVAFSNVLKPPKSQSLANCKIASNPKDSPGVVAYPITSILGAQNQYISSKQKYEVYVDNGTTFVTVNIGANVLKSSFGGNDPKGFYKATISLTEADI